MPAGDEQRLAVMDLGSNSFRLVVFTARDGWWKRTDEIYEAVRIGEGLAATGELGEAGMARAPASMEVFAHFCSASGLEADEIDAVATSAIRDATNAASSSTAPRPRRPARPRPRHGGGGALRLPRRRELDDARRRR